MNPAYHLKDIEFSYNGQVALKVAEQQINAGEITALVGPNGSGKTTLMNLLAFINLPGAGALDFFGEPAIRAGYEKFRRRIGYIQQKPYLLNTTVFRNIELGLKLRKVGKSERMERTGEIIERLGLTTLASRRAHDLSGGEAQKVAVARVLVLRPDVLILDEPFSHLDNNFRQEFEGLLRACKTENRQTVIFSTHDQTQIHVLADSIYSFIDGYLIPSSVTNLFTGVVDAKRNIFITGKLEIRIPDTCKSGNKMCIDSTHLVLSKSEIESSMRNNFRGRIKSIEHKDGQVHVEVNAGETFHAVITKSALHHLEINAGDSIWVCFKSTAIKVY